MRIWKIVCLALAGLGRTPLRAALTCLGVAIAAGALVSMVAFALGLQVQAEAPFEQLGLINNIEVSPKNSRDSRGFHGDPSDPDDAAHGDPDDPDGADGAAGDEPGNATEAEDGPVLDDEAVGRIEAIEGVTLAYPDFRANDVRIGYGEKTRNAIAVGLPRDQALRGLLGEVLVAGDMFGLKEAPEAILGQQLVAELGFASPADAVGKVVRVETGGLLPGAAGSFTFQQQKLDVTVVGVYTLPQMGPRFFRSGVILPVELMKEVPGVGVNAILDQLRAGKDAATVGYQRVTVRVEHPSALIVVERQIRDMGFRTHTLLSDLKEMRTFFVFMDSLLACVGTVALIVAALGIVNTLLMSVLERQREIGIYKAIGASDGDLLVLFLTEASLIGVAGGLGGLALGRAVSWGLEIGVNYYARSQGVETHVAVFDFPLWLLAGVILFSAAVAVLAGVYPAIRAARVDPIRALRSE